MINIEISSPNHKTKTTKLLSSLVLLGMALFVILIAATISFLFIKFWNNEKLLDNATFAAIISAVEWIVKSLPSVITWPIVVLIILSLIMASSSGANRLSQLFSSFRRIKMFGAEISFSEEGAKQLFQSAEDAFTQYRRLADLESSRLALSYNVRQKLQSLIERHDLLDQLSQNPSTEFRCTIYIPDSLFDNTLLQLVDYYPKGAGAGRRFSSRYGIVGRAWRAEEHSAEGAAATTARNLVDQWGMTKEEALHGTRQKPSYVCCIIKDKSDNPVAVIFMDSKTGNSFGNKDSAIKFAIDLEQSCKILGLQEALVEIVNKLRESSVKINAEI